MKFHSIIYIIVKDNQLIGTFSTPLENGSYTIVWKIVGEDGHLQPLAKFRLM
ncbi:copper resistance protein CopC [Parageobacillus sp. SY1]|nr:copper resistance protein CopC [Parageobacillus sp. SY1]